MDTSFQAQNIADQYTLFTRYCRHEISNALKSGNYPNIRGTNTKGGSNVKPKDYKARVTIIGRSPDMIHSGKGNLASGSLEAILIVQAPFSDTEDFKHGFDLSNAGLNEGGFRFTVGRNLRAVGFWHGFDSAYKQGAIKTFLESGDYTFLINELLLRVNAGVEGLKTMDDLWIGTEF